MIVHITVIQLDSCVSVKIIHSPFQNYYVEEISKP